VNSFNWAPDRNEFIGQVYIDLQDILSQLPVGAGVAGVDGGLD
jgi:hypothetical protein